MINEINDSVLPPIHKQRQTLVRLNNKNNPLDLVRLYTASLQIHSE